MSYYAHIAHSLVEEKLIHIDSIYFLVTQEERYNKKKYITVHGVVVGYKNERMNECTELTSLRCPTLEEHNGILKEIERYKSEGVLEGEIELWYDMDH